MNKLSIRLKITLWFAAVLIVIVGLACLVLVLVLESVMQKQLREDLAYLLEDNVVEIKYVDSMGGGYDGGAQYIAYGDGYLAVDDDYLHSINGITAALYNKNGDLLYGRNPIAVHTRGVAFVDGVPRTIDASGSVYYLLDRKLEIEGLFLRGTVPETVAQTPVTRVAHMSLYALPALVAAALLGGYVFAGRALRPIRRISDAANSISNGRDLKQRINIGEGDDELHRLANTFDDMFERLDRAFETEKRFASDASHELRTPMAVIMAQCEYTLEEPRSQEEYVEALQTVQRQGSKMSRLISDMLSFTRLERKADSFVLEPLDYSELVSSVCDDMTPLRLNNIALEADITPGIMVNGNAELLSRLVTNLISNAYRYGRENGHIRVKLVCGDAAVLTVSDDGIGISPQNRERIFERFYQADTSRSNEGTGLGLSMAQEIASMHGGSISVDSIEGVGSVFTVKIPSIVG